MNKALLRARIDKLLADNNVEGVKDIIPLGHPLYQKVYRQLFNNKEADVTYDVLYVLLDKFKDLSSDWLIRGEGPMSRTEIHTPPTHRQDIHIAEGATAAISQSGEATVTNEATATTEPEQPAFTPADIARMLRENDTAGLVAIIMDQQSTIMSQKDTINRMLSEQNDILKRSMKFIDEKIFPFPEVK